MRRMILKGLYAWLPIAVACCFIYAITYLGIQQYIRLSADEILVQYAEDARDELERGYSQELVLGRKDTVNMLYSLSPFIMLYNSRAEVVATNVILNKCAPAIPAGALAAAKRKGENRVTWQPKEV